MGLSHIVARHACALLLFAGSLAPALAEPVRGITLSTHTDGSDWASPLLGETLEEIRETGAEWVAIHPYAAIRGDGSVRYRPLEAGNPPAYLARPIAEAHAAGLKILIKPHLAYWGSPFRWRGEISFADEASWDRFWETYTNWILELARTTREADGFVVGTELDRSLVFAERWRELIRRVRRITDVPLTYAANWTDFERVPFWEELDVIGIQAYFPLSDRPDPDEDTIRRAWQSWMKRLRRVSAEQNRSIVFTELGYTRSFSAPVEPWNDHTDGPEAERVQQACLRAALEAIETEPSVLGAFLWKWFPRPYSNGRNYRLATPQMKRAIREIWRGEP